MGKDTASQKDCIHRFVPDRYADPRRASRYTYYNEYFVYEDHARLLIRRVNSLEVVADVLFDKEKLDHVTPLHWSTSRSKSWVFTTANKKTLSFGRALGLTNNGKVFALTDEGVYDFRSHRVIPMSDRRFETVDADTMKLVLRRPSDGEIFHILFDSDAYDTIKDTIWWVADHKAMDRNTVVVNGIYKGRNIMLDALLLDFPKGLIRKYPCDRRELDYRGKTLRKRIIVNVYRAVSADTVALIVNHPVLKTFRVLIDKQMYEKVAAHHWYVCRSINKKKGRQRFFFVDNDGVRLTEVILEAPFYGVIPVDEDGVYDCRRKSLLAERQVNLCTPLGKDAVRLVIPHPGGATRVLLDKEDYERLKHRRWYVRPAGPEGCCQIHNSKGHLLHRRIFNKRRPKYVREHWPMDKTIDLRKEALITCVCSAYRQLDRLSGEMVVTAETRQTSGSKDSAQTLQTLHIRVDHEDGLELDRCQWSFDLPDKGGMPFIFCSKYPCMLRAIRRPVRAFVVLAPEYDESGRIDARKQSLAQWCPQNHYRFLDARRMELRAPVVGYREEVRVLLDRQDYDRLRRHVWTARYSDYQKAWLVRNQAREDLRTFLFDGRFHRFSGLPPMGEQDVPDFRKARLAPYGIVAEPAAAPKPQQPKPKPKRVKPKQAYAKTKAGQAKTATAGKQP